jgi:hypothetical protein
MAQRINLAQGKIDYRYDKNKWPTATPMMIELF